MTRSERNAIADIIRINPFIYKLQDKINEETERVIDDKSSPTRIIISQLKSIEKRRIDLCNLKVLYGIIERELKEEFSVLKLCAERHADCSLFMRARKSIQSVGYDCKRVSEEFKYLFAMLGRPKRNKPPVANNHDYSHACSAAGAAV